MTRAASPLQETLLRLTRRLNRLALLRWLVLAACAGLLAYAAITVSHRLGLSESRSLAPLGGVVVTGLAFALSLLAKRPGQADAARLADRGTAAAERFSTAHEVAVRGPRSVVETVLMHDVEQLATGVRPETLAPVPMARLLAPLGICALAALGANLVPQSAQSEGTQAIAIAADLSDEERTDLAADIQRVAAFMTQQAEGRSDDYATAVARTLDNLGQRLGAGETLSRSDLRAELASLQDYAIAATSEWRGVSGQRISELIATLNQRLDTPSPAPPAERLPAQGNAAEPIETADVPPNLGTGVPQAPAQPSAGQPDDFAEKMAAAEAAVQGSAGAVGEDPAPQAPRAVGSYLDIARAQNEAQIASQGTEMGENAQLIGPSANSQAGDSLLAGEGTDALGDAASAPLSFETTEDVTLEATDSGEGQRIERLVTPPTQRTVIVLPDDLSTQVNWVRQAEAEIARSTVPLADQELVSAYRQALKGQVAP